MDVAVSTDGTFSWSLTSAEWGFLPLLTAFPVQGPLCSGRSGKEEHGAVTLEASEQQLFPVIDTAIKIKKTLLL